MGKQDPIYKFGNYKAIENKIHYNFVVNRDQVKKIYNFQTEPTDDNYLNTPLNENFADKNIVLVDELPDGLEFDLSSLQFSVPLYSPGLDSALKPIKNPTSESVLEPYLKLNNEKTAVVHNGKTYFKFVKSDSTGKEWNSFRNEIKSASESTVGIWENKKMVINFNKIPDANKKYSDLYGNLEFAIEHLKDKKITKGQATYMKAAYCGDRPIVSYGVHFDTIIKGKVKSEYSNTVHYENGDADKDKKTHEIYLAGLNNRFKLGRFSGSIKVKKQWLGTPKWPVRVSLLKDGIRVGEPIILNQDKQEAVFAGLSSTGNYEIIEDEVPGYRTKITKEADGTILIRNIEEKVQIKVKKFWINTSVSGSFPIKVSLIKKGDSAKTPVVPSITLKEYPWEGTFSPVDRYDGDGNKIEYVVEEVPAGTIGDLSEFDITYKSMIEKDGIYLFEIQNEKKTPDPPDVPHGFIDIDVKKEWLLANGATKDSTLDDKPEIEVELFEKQYGYTDFRTTGIKLKLNKGNDYKGKFSHLERYDTASLEIEYEVRETSIPSGYIKVQDGTDANSYTIKNKKEPAPILINIGVKKEWLLSDGATKDSTLDDKPEIEVELFKKENSDSDFRATGQKRKLNKGNGYAAEFKNFRKFDDAAKEIQYEVRETSVPSGYIKVQDGTAANSYTIKNKKEPTPERPPYIPPTPEQPTPPTPEQPTPPTPKQPTPPTPEQPTPPTPEQPTPPTPKQPTPPTPKQPTPPTPEQPTPPTPEQPTPPTPEQPTSPIPMPPPPEEAENVPPPSIIVPNGEIPRGDTKIPKVPPTLEDPDEDIAVDEDDIPLGDTETDKEKRVLAKTGGLRTVFIPVFFVLTGLGILLVVLEMLKRKDRILKK